VSSSILTFCNVLVNEKREVAKKNEVVFYYYYYYLLQSRGPYHKHNRRAQIWLAIGRYFLKTLKLSSNLHDTLMSILLFSIAILVVSVEEAFLPFLPGFYKT